ncbi:Ras-like protein 2 [Tritrichomonas foetus]|uniref:Ras-like protein 2 n=1 Tax=Tritrichomonas foetus TaxID=1144522 RepID=A0A1J4JVZ5_9EUKA|nr:Ras-like protein 2 [Tritrichomonas foetus]|eukprot:OHT03303.1 Ras-like protein 2 [Tritrichomonas foetus]
MTTYKIGMVGSGGVGKTAISLQFIKNAFTDSYIPTIEDEFTKTIEVDGKPVTLEIIDTAGQDEFAEMRSRFFSEFDAAILTFSIIEPDSMADLKKTYDDIRAVRNQCKFIIAANKTDLRNSDSIPTSEFSKLEKEFNCKVLQTSARTGLNVTELFHQIVRELRGKSGNTSPPSKETKSQQKQEGGCCNIQ